MKKFKDKGRNILIWSVFWCVFILIIFSAVYFSWWRCGEMFPNAQLACFMSGR